MEDFGNIYLKSIWFQKFPPAQGQRNGFPGQPGAAACGMVMNWMSCALRGRIPGNLMLKTWWNGAIWDNMMQYVYNRFFNIQMCGHYTKSCQGGNCWMWFQEMEGYGYVCHSELLCLSFLFAQKIGRTCRWSHLTVAVSASECCQWQHQNVPTWKGS